jgi:N-hydroxyarylamine O-acetyltransferase
VSVEEYLRRIGAVRPRVLDIHSLCDLQRRHLESVPFENLGAYLGQPVELGEDALFRKIVRQRRGGICYELNGAFAALLSELGFDVRLLGGRVSSPEGGLGPPLDHLALSVELDEPWLVDVGFGRFSMRPLRLGTDMSQDDPAGRFGVRAAPQGDVDVLRDGVVVYRLELRPRELDEFRAMAWWHSTSPRSPFAQGPTCSLVTPDGGRITLAGHRLIETAGTKRTERYLEGDHAALAAYRRYFGIDLDRVPEPFPTVLRQQEHTGDFRT